MNRLMDNGAKNTVRYLILPPVTIWYMLEIVANIGEFSNLFEKTAIR